MLRPAGFQTRATPPNTFFNEPVTDLSPDQKTMMLLRTRKAENIVVKSQIDTLFQNAILTPTEVAAELSLKIETVRDLMRRGILPASKIGGSWRTTRRALYGYLENQMGLEIGVHGKRRKNPGKGVLQVQRRSKTVGKRRKKETHGESEKVFFSR
jgi:excisionase family DNA binding protein